MLHLPSPSSWIVLRKSGVNLKCSASHVPTEEAHDPTCMAAPIEQQCRCSPKKLFSSALCIVGRGKGSNPDCLLSPRQDTLWKAFDTYLPSQRAAVMHHQMCNHSSYSTAQHPAHWQRSLLIGIGLEMLISWATGDLPFSCRLWIWIALRIPGKSWHIHSKSCLFPECSLSCTQPW